MKHAQREITYRQTVIQLVPQRLVDTFIADRVRKDSKMRRLLNLIEDREDDDDSAALQAARERSAQERAAKRANLASLGESVVMFEADSEKLASSRAMLDEAVERRGSHATVVVPVETADESTADDSVTSLNLVSEGKQTE
jgi:hypothetical protein